ncbi:Protein of unknown function [Gryllus bimaculatus]|nr:Protein of unknown function [Gryllus bimaculatus]
MLRPDRQRQRGRVPPFPPVEGGLSRGGGQAQQTAATTAASAFKTKPPKRNRSLCRRLQPTPGHPPKPRNLNTATTPPPVPHPTRPQKPSTSTLTTDLQFTPNHPETPPQPVPGRPPVHSKTTTANAQPQNPYPTSQFNSKPPEPTSTVATASSFTPKPPPLSSGAATSLTMHVLALALAALTAFGEATPQPPFRTFSNLNSSHHLPSLTLDAATRLRDRRSASPSKEGVISATRKFKRSTDGRTSSRREGMEERGMEDRVWKTEYERQSMKDRRGVSGGGVAGGAVAVVDLGDAPRWLRALHSSARAPVLLWSAGDASQRPGVPPAWLEHQAGYVLAALSARRLQKFLVRDTANAVVDHNIARMTGESHRRQLMLNSGAPTVLSVLALRTAAKQEPKADLLLIRALRHIHMSFRGLSLHQEASGETRGQAYCKDALFDDWCRYDGMCESAALKTAEKCARDSSGELVMVALPEGPGRRHWRWDPNYILLRHIQQAMNMRFRQVHVPPQHPGGSALPSLLKMAVEGRVQLLALPILLTERSLAPLEMMPAAGGVARRLLAVPRAGVMAGWARVTSVFGGNAGAAAMVAAAAFVLAWRETEREWSPAEAARRRRPHRRRLRRRLSSALLVVVSMLLYVVAIGVFRYLQRKGPGRYRQIDTIQQLIESGQPILAPDFHPEVPTQSRVFLTIRPVNATAIREMMFQEVPPALALWDSEWPERDTERFLGRKMHVLRESLQEAFSTWLTAGNWPWTNRINTFILQVNSMGLRDFWRKEYVELITMFGGHSYFDWLFEYQGQRLLSLPDVVPFLEGLGAGLFLATIAFLAELLCCRKRAARLRAAAAAARAAEAAATAASGAALDAGLGPPAPAASPMGISPNLLAPIHGTIHGLRPAPCPIRGRRAVDVDPIQPPRPLGRSTGRCHAGLPRERR